MDINFGNPIYEGVIILNKESCSVKKIFNAISLFKDTTTLLSVKKDANKKLPKFIDSTMHLKDDVDNYKIVGEIDFVLENLSIDYESEVFLFAFSPIESEIMNFKQEEILEVLNYLKGKLI